MKTWRGSAEKSPFQHGDSKVCASLPCDTVASKYWGPHKFKPFFKKFLYSTLQESTLMYSKTVNKKIRSWFVRRGFTVFHFRGWRRFWNADEKTPSIIANIDWAVAVVQAVCWPPHLESLTSSSGQLLWKHYYSVAHFIGKENEAQGG